MSQHALTSKVWASHGTGLGDCIASIMVYNRYSVECDATIRVSTWYPRRGRRKDYGSKWNEILPLLDLPGCIEMVDDEPQDRHHWTEGCSAEYCNTCTRWTAEALSSRVVAYQFDGKSHKAKNFPTEQEEQLVLAGIREAGYDTVRLGWSQTLAEGVDVLAGAAAFVGVDSGFCHLAHCVGTPVIMPHNRETEETMLCRHENKHFVLTSDAADTVLAMREFAKGGLDYYIEHCRFVDRFQLSLRELVCTEIGLGPYDGGIDSRHAICGNR